MWAVAFLQSLTKDIPHQYSQLSSLLCVKEQWFFNSTGAQLQATSTAVHFLYFLKLALELNWLLLKSTDQRLCFTSLSHAHLITFVPVCVISGLNYVCVPSAGNGNAHFVFLLVELKHRSFPHVCFLPRIKHVNINGRMSR